MLAIALPLTLATRRALHRLKLKRGERHPPEALTILGYYCCYMEELVPSLRSSTRATDGTGPVTH